MSSHSDICASQLAKVSWCRRKRWHNLAYLTHIALVCALCVVIAAECMSRIEYLIPTNNIIVFDSIFNLTNKSNLIFNTLLDHLAGACFLRYHVQPHEIANIPLIPWKKPHWPQSKRKLSANDRSLPPTIMHGSAAGCRVDSKFLVGWTTLHWSPQICTTQKCRRGAPMQKCW